MSETAKWFRLFALLAGIGIILWLFLSRGPEFLAQLLSAGVFIPLAMTKRQGDDEKKTPTVAALVIVGAIIMLLTICGGAILKWIW